ncbi:MAG: trehalase family glycosidase, partial [Planctomycetota bacterium]|nr:trehalase family glycosidase [Planctomycetota bacterium]
ADLCAPCAALPHVWSEGLLFAQSGLDGWTKHANAVVCAADRVGYDLLLHRPKRRVLRLRLPGTSETHIATGDVLAASAGAENLVMTMARHEVIVGSFSAGVEIGLDQRDDVAIDEIEDEDGSQLGWISIDEGVDAVALVHRDGRFALAVASDPDEAIEDAEMALERDPWVIAASHLTMYHELPGSGDDQELAAKCLSVMRVNAMSPEGSFDIRWSTPDRVPHRDCWLWDSAFHAVGMQHCDPRAASEYLTAVYRSQRDDGMIPHQCRPNGTGSAITQPPILMWAAWQVWQRTGDEKDLKAAAYHGARYLEWDLANRDSNGNSLLEWFIEDNPHCRSGESGLDNSQRFDEALCMDAVDFSVFVAEDMRHLALILRELGQDDEAARWDQRAAATRAAIHELLWDDQAGLYVDRHMDGHLSSIQSVVGFLPLLLEDLPSERRARLLTSLADPARFAAAHPIPAIALNDPNWSTDMWRGSTWINTNYLVIEGLRRQGCQAEHDALRRATLDLVFSHYRRAGTSFEFYDARGEVVPERCLRKGPVPEPYECRSKTSAIRDYHWTAALCFDLIATG